MLKHSIFKTKRDMFNLCVSVVTLQNNLHTCMRTLNTFSHFVLIGSQETDQM